MKTKRIDPTGMMEEYGLNDENMEANEFDIIFTCFAVKLMDSRKLKGLLMWPFSHFLM